MATVAPYSLPLADTWAMHGAGAGWMTAMMIGMGLFWGAVVLGIVWLVRDGVAQRRHPAREPALTILERRFAEGAVSPDDYQQRRNVLTGSANRDQDLTSSESEGVRP
jgi:putative membrane protein